MRAVVQRVLKASVNIDSEIYRDIAKGLLVFLAVEKDDDEHDLEYIYNKVLDMRIFSDKDDKLNLSVKDKGYQLLIISQFTLYGDMRKGKRPNFTRSAAFDKGKKFYDLYIEKLKKDSIDFKCGEFGRDMKVSLINDGPVTVLLDSRREF